MSQLILQPFCCFIYVTANSPTLLLPLLRHRIFTYSFSKLSVTSTTSQLILILQAFHHFTYVTAHSPTLPSLYLRHSSFSSPPVTSPTSQLILEPFFCFSYFTGFSLTSPGEPPMVSGPSLWFFHLGEEIVIAWTHIGWVRWMFQNLPLPAAQEVRNSSGVTLCIVMKNIGFVYHQVLSFSPESNLTDIIEICQHVTVDSEISWV